MMQSDTITLPDMISFCGTPKPISPHYEQVVAEATQWLSDVAHLEAPLIDKIASWKFGLLACITYPGACASQLRTCIDFFNMCSLLDEFVEDSDQDMAAVLHSLLGSMTEPETVESTDMFGKMVRDIHKRICLTASPGTHRAIVKATDEWLQSVIKQTQDHKAGVLPTVDEYIVFRRDNSAVNIFLSWARYVYKLDIPDEVLAHPTITAMEDAANDFKSWCNDIYSYNVEQSNGLTTNMVTVVMHQDNLDVQAAIDFVWGKCKDVHAHFLENKKKLPSWDEKTNKDVAIYVDGLMDWMAGFVHWAYQSEKYFEKSGSEVKEMRVVKLLPKSTAAPALASNVFAVPALPKILVEMPPLGSAQVNVGLPQA